VSPSHHHAPLALAVGDPGGIGPEVAVAGAVAEPDLSVVLVGPGADLQDRVATLTGARPPLWREATGAASPLAGTGVVAVVDAAGSEPVAPGRPSPEGGRAQLASLDAAVALVRGGRARALVTGPTSKEAAVAAGVPFRGQTEYLARGAGLPDDAVSMLFLGPRLRVGLVTTHLPLSAVAREVTGPRVARTLRHLGEALVAEARGLDDPRPRTLVVAGLNPHAGEGGLFGREEIEVIGPAIAQALGTPPFREGRVRCLGLRPAEAAFRLAADGAVDGVVAMAHDQATIASKLLDWGAAVNVTWGLPFVRTSVDHGVAYDIVGAGRADPSGMRAALRLADRLTRDPDATPLEQDPEEAEAPDVR